MHHPQGFSLHQCTVEKLLPQLRHLLQHRRHNKPLNQLRMWVPVLFKVVPDCWIQKKWTRANSKDDSCKSQWSNLDFNLYQCCSPIGSGEHLDPSPPLRSWEKLSHYRPLVQFGMNETSLKCPGSSHWILVQWVGSCSLIGVQDSVVDASKDRKVSAGSGCSYPVVVDETASKEVIPHTCLLWTWFYY